jgi:hypothetical protein
MVEVYYYIPVNKAENAVACGIKLSEWYDREAGIEGNVKRCISTLLNPRDDYEKYISPDYKCLKLEIMSKYCFAADKFLYNAVITFPEIMEIYKRSIIPIEKYNFGLYRLPECLVTSTIISDFVSVLDKRLDSPILFGSSEDLYMNNIIESYKETHSDFTDAMLYSFYSRLAEEGKVRCMEDVRSGTAIFIDERDGRTYTLKIPEMGKY